MAAANEPDDDLEPDDVEDDPEFEDDGVDQTEVTIEVRGLSLYTHHGVSAAEREGGQRLVLDIRLEVGDCDATVTDMVEDTVDYGEVCNTVSLVAQQRSYKTLERLCSAVADRLLGEDSGDEVWVKAAKPEPPIPLPVDEVSVEVWRQRGGAEDDGRAGRMPAPPQTTAFDADTAVVPAGGGARPGVYDATISDRW